MGYKVGHYEIPLNVPDVSLSIQMRIRDHVKENPVACFREMFVIQDGIGRPLLVPFVPSISDPSNMVAACMHRFGCDMPEPKLDVMRDFVQYSRVFILRYVKHLADDDIKPFDAWLDGVGYSAARRDSLRNLRKNMIELSSKCLVAKGFIKFESYKCPKNPRAILSYSDDSKVLLGPLINAMDKCQFKSLSHLFVKGTDPADWPKRLRDTFGTMPVNCTDFTSFEAHHRGDFAYIIYFWMAHILRNVSGASVWRAMIKALVLGRNEIVFKHIRVEVDRRLMSGALWTSSANGMLNMLIMSYLTLKVKFPLLCTSALVEKASTDFRGLFEGDDGITEFVPIPQSLIDSLGLKLKLERQSCFEEAGFCSIYCDGRSLATVRDPKKTLQNFFMLPAEYQNSKRSKVLSYFRAKALSLKYLYPNAPIVGPMMDWVLRRTKSFDPNAALDHIDLWHKNTLLFALKSNKHKSPAVVDVTSRQMVEKIFGISYARQLTLEDSFIACKDDFISLDLRDLAEREHYTQTQLFLQERGMQHTTPDAVVPDAIQQVCQTGVLRASRGRTAIKNMHKNFFKTCGSEIPL